MAQSYTTQDGITLYEPGTVVSTKVKSNQSGSAAAGSVTLIGEAEEGPDWTQEEELDDNSFGPDEIDRLTAKYGSGRLVDAFRAVVAAANDPAIVGAVQEIKVVKTNASVAAYASLTRNGLGTFAQLVAKREGSPGNLISYQSAVSQAESAPTTGLFSYCPDLSATIAFYLRVNGGDRKTVTVPPLTSGPALIALVEDIDEGILCQGGEQELPLTGLTGETLTASAPDASTLVVTLPTSIVWGSAPEAGDVVVIPDIGSYGASAKSSIAGTSDENLGSYIVTGVTNTASSATLTLKAINISGAATLADTGLVNAGADDMIVFKPVSISNQTGMDREVAGSTAYDWACTLNDGTNIVLGITTASSEWDAQPVVGDIMKVPSAFAGIAAGFYQVTSSTSSTVSAARLSVGSAGTTGTASSVVAGFSVLKPVLDGLGKSMEVEGTVSGIFKQEDGSAVTFGDSLISSAAEYKNTMTVTKEGVSGSFIAGGEIVLKIGSSKDDAVMVIDEEKVQLKEGSTVIVTAAYSQVKTLSDFVGLVNSINGYSAEVSSAKYSVNGLSWLDRGTYNIQSSISEKPGRIKKDAYVWSSEMDGSAFVSNTLSAQAGLPEAISPAQYLSNGSKAGSTALDFANAISACSYIETNFIVPLVSRDSTEDILDGETESSSTYTVDAVNALARSHVIESSALKAKRNRVALVSRRGSFSDQQDAAGDLSSFRCSMCIQDVKMVGSDGLIYQYQPWMAAVVAAGMQAAAGYKGIVKKFSNISGLLHYEGDFNPKSASMRETALKAGLLVMEPVKTGGYRWISDQMTYSVDSNFVYNSLQAVYVSDLMALSLIAAFDRAIVGKSVAEVDAAGGLAFLELQMYNFYRLRWIAQSDDAPRGYKNASVKVQGGVMLVSVEAKLAGLIYFVPISLAISEVTQTASS